MKKHGDVIIKFNELNSKLMPHGLFIYTWGKMAITKISDPYNNFY